MLIKKIKLSITIILLISVNSMGAYSNELIVEIDNPKFSEKSLDDKIYEIKAKKGLKSENEIDLFTIAGKFKSKNNGKWIFLEADIGKYQQSINVIKLEKNIKFYTDEGEIVKSNYASYDIINNVINMEENIIHEINNGVVYSDKSIISKNFNNLLYTGNVSATLRVND
tara:strand:- start:1252 stop:1758 length:507 start_codon:yes stop_codon:yes gene_type:complete